MPMPMQTNALSASSAWSTAAAPRPAKADLETDRPLILIVDDDEDVRSALRELLLSVEIDASCFASTRELWSAADSLEGNGALDMLFRHQLTDLLATRLLAAHTGSPTTIQPTMGGLSPKVLLRATERLRSDSDADVSLAALASDAGLSRFHFCRAFKESTGLSPHAWLRQTEIPPQAVQSTNPISIIFYKDWPAKPAPPIGFQSGRLLGSRGCQAACERPMPMSVMSNCPAP